MTIILDYAIPTEFVVSKDMFGGNDLFLHNLLSGSNASFPIATDLLGVTGLRYPGGTMTEYNFDVSNPDGPPLNTSDETFVGISEFLRYAESAGRSPTIVLPTRQMYVGDLDPNTTEPRSIQDQYLNQVLTFVTNLISNRDSGVGALPDLPIAAFEIGNEYWGSGEMTAAEYGQLVNELVPKIVQIFDTILGTDAPHPKILVQMGSPWGSQYREGIYSELSWLEKLAQSNNDIISQITDPSAKTGISGLIEHYYYVGQDEELYQDSASKSYINLDILLWENAGFTDLDLAITEWGVDHYNSAQFGLRGAAVIIEQMQHMIAMGADSAFAWPVQGWNTALAGAPNSVPKLSPMGAAFMLMAESIEGTHLLSNGVSSEKLEIDAFGSDEKVVIFVMSRADTSQVVDLDITKFVEEYTSIDGLKIGVASGENIADPKVCAVLTHYLQKDLGNGSLLNFTLDPFEVIRIEFLLPLGKHYVGTAGADRHAAGAGDDTMFGGGGADSLQGGRGDDVIRGSSGRDFLNGWAGDDSISGGTESDFIYSQEGDDGVYGGAGDDYLRGDGGNDSIRGGNGRDQLFGNDGADLLSGGLGADSLSGGAGADTFVFNSTEYSVSKADRVKDMESGIDRIAISHLAFLDMPFGAVSNASFVASNTGVAVDEANRILYDLTSGVIWYDRDGIGTTYDRVVLAVVDPLLDICAPDFYVF